jgi:hypothetical protein
MVRIGSVRLVACAALAMVGVACSSSSSGGDTGPANVVTGTIVGRTVDAKDAVSYTSGSTTVVAIGDYANMCSYGTATKSLSNVLMFTFGSTTLTATKISFGADPSLSVQYTYFDTACNGAVTAGTSAGFGSVTLSKADSSAVVGTFDVTINGDHVTGKFNAPACAALNNAGPATAATDGGTSSGGDTSEAGAPAGDGGSGSATCK